MPQISVNRGSTARLGRVEGKLKVGSNAKIVAASGRKVTVTEGANFEGNAELDCDFECDSLTVERGYLHVAGDLVVRKRLDIAHGVYADGAINAHDIDVGGKMRARSVSSAGSVRVGGVIDVEETMEALSVQVGGKATVRGAVKLADLGVGGKADVGGGTISGHTQVGGHFASTGPLELGELLVYGRCVLPAGSSGKKISASGKLSVGGDFKVDEMLVNGRFEVSGSLAVKGILETNGSCEVRGDLTGTDLRVGGWFRARKAVLGGEANIAGETETMLGMKAKSVSIQSGTRCKGALVGERIELGKSWLVVSNWSTQLFGQSIVARGIAKTTVAEDLYGSEVILGPSSKCRRIVAKRVELGDGCMVERVTYTDELRRGRGKVFLTLPPEKVSELPPFPL